MARARKPAVKPELLTAPDTKRPHLNRAAREERARLVNAEPWEPLRGMVKRQCAQCQYLFASPAKAQSAICADCAGEGSRSRVSC